MIEKVNPSHPDKVADRIAGALVDYCYTIQENPRCAFEVLIGHGVCTIICESSVNITEDIVLPIVNRIVGEKLEIKIVCVPQDAHLAKNQSKSIKCGDNGIFLGLPMTDEEIEIDKMVQYLYSRYPTDGKFIIDAENKKIIACQSCCDKKELFELLKWKFSDYRIIVNPLGDWTGGINVDTGATNRKLGSDMGHSVTGGGLHGKDLSKADVCVNIYAWLESQRTNKKVEISCAIGDDIVNEISYNFIIECAKKYINQIGGFEAFAEWGFDINKYNEKYKYSKIVFN